MRVRAAQEGDLAAIGALWNHTIRSSLATFNSVEKTPEDLVAALEARRAAGQGFLVAETAEGFAGFGIYFPFRGGIGYRHTLEHTIYVADAAQGQGIGRALLGALEDHARAAGHHSLFAGVSSGNPAGRAFHAALGYADVATLKEVGFKWDQWLDLHLMQKFL